MLVGTNSIESSEGVSALLTKHKIKHEVLNAKQHEREAEIVANAGSPGAVTISTNMAGRGTDIVLAEDLLKVPVSLNRMRGKISIMLLFVQEGLHIVGTERNESRRVDNQP